jgi:hypothetical protein
MIVCRSPEDVKSYLDYRFRVKYGFPVREPEGKEKKKLEAVAAAAAAAAAAAQRAAKRNNADTPESEMQWGLYEVPARIILLQAQSFGSR